MRVATTKNARSLNWLRFSLSSMESRLWVHDANASKNLTSLMLRCAIGRVYEMIPRESVGAENGHIPMGGQKLPLRRDLWDCGAKLRGTGLIIGVETVPRRQELARTYGADAIADFSKEDVVQRILDWSGSLNSAEQDSFARFLATQPP